MKLRIVRHCEADVTLGDLYVDGTWQCKTLEDVDRRLEAGGVKIPGDTAIPLGTYRVVIDRSARFRRMMLHILDVPQFAGVRIHAGNTTMDTEGCPLVGEDVDGDTIVRSRAALAELQPMVQAALDRDEDVWLTVERA